MVADRPEGAMLSNESSRAIESPVSLLLVTMDVEATLLFRDSFKDSPEDDTGKDDSCASEIALWIPG